MESDCQWERVPSHKVALNCKEWTWRLQAVEVLEMGWPSLEKKHLFIALKAKNFFTNEDSSQNKARTYRES